MQELSHYIFSAAGAQEGTGSLVGRGFPPFLLLPLHDNVILVICKKKACRISLHAARVMIRS
jgi:hypothetical protein